MRPAVAALLLVFATSAVAGDPAADLRAKARRDAVEQLKKGAAASDVVNRLVGAPDASASLLAAVDCVAWLAAASRDAVVRRDAQGREMYAFYKARFTGRDPTSADVTAYDALRVKNRDACREVAEREAEIDAMAKAARSLGAAIPSADAEDAAVADALRAVLRSSRLASVRPRVLDALRGPVVAALAPDVEKIALKGDTRADRVAALRCLATIGPKNHVDALRPCLETEDPFVRRAAFPVFVAVGSKEAVDALVMRTPVEVGVPGNELQAALLALTGQAFGDSARAWEQWWTEARESWTGPPAVRAAPPAAKRAATNYFGLALDSMRVLFVVDTSGSMQFAVSYGARDGGGLDALETKMDVARRELVQAIVGLPDGASFNVVAFGTSTKSFSGKLVAATAPERKRARTWIEKLEADGATNMSGALLDAFDSLTPTGAARDEEVADTIVVMTDGVPNCGPIDSESDLLAEIRRRNGDRAVAVHCVYLGNEGDARFMERLAAESGGQFVHRTK